MTYRCWQQGYHHQLLPGALCCQLKSHALSPALTSPPLSWNLSVRGHLQRANIQSLRKPGASSKSISIVFSVCNTLLGLSGPVIAILSQSNMFTWHKQSTLAVKYIVKEQWRMYNITTGGTVHKIHDMVWFIVWRSGVQQFFCLILSTFQKYHTVHIQHLLIFSKYVE